ncbi:phage protein NinX family protein [Xenorhabdus griffiniae]|uniref:DUF2591 family protein n=1 Tax=Xenorhabdus griffiniae TaxID=351672 RepID=A0ABY9XMM5_9GAMM|nr:phage protein NinX family protein [Xenorhabdus griffiniae]MBD1229352.1 DUF2591 family protein [Xenorhabdus griffiniae]MBE8589107.1 DUF2591 family protein [Xenorhabdus griffiniae]WMV74017.1 DUF2591 family protein [Xenorhabdus griffiniae]WNH03697.1 DUF2591 family protein [Xenorhabdus griffiniae]
MKIKTSALTGRALDWAVAMINESMPTLINENGKYVVGIPNLFSTDFNGNLMPAYYQYSPSTNWALCGQLMDKYCKSFGMVQGITDKTWRAFAYGIPCRGQDTMRLASGDTLKIAFCRALVTAQLGDEVEIPDELVEAK